MTTTATLRPKNSKVRIDRRLWRLVVVLLMAQFIAHIYLLEHSFLWSSVSSSKSSFPSNPSSAAAAAAAAGTALAFHESYGFFRNVPDDEWNLKRQRARAAPHHLDATHDRVSDFYYRPRGWYQNNWEPDFSCNHLTMLGPIRDGHKWVCDPHRIVDTDDCLVYSLGSNGNFDFEEAVWEAAPHCEIHIFDPGRYEFRMKQSKLKQANAHYHTFGIKSSYETDSMLLNGHKNLPPGAFKTFPQAVQELGHTGKTVSVFKVDIEGGEWTTFRDWLDPKTILLQQILVEVHDAPPIANTFFAELHRHGYVMFSKEPNIQFAGGDAVEFGFLRLRSSFFGSDTMPLEHSSQALEHWENNKADYQRNKNKAEYDYGREMRANGVI